MLFGVRKYQINKNNWAGLKGLAFIILLLFCFNSSAQRDRSGAGNVRDVSDENVDSLRANQKTDSIPVFDLSYSERFNSIKFTTDLTHFKYEALDTALDAFQIYNPANKKQYAYKHIGTLGSPAYSFLPNFESEFDFDLGYNQFKAYQLQTEDLKIYKLNAPYTFANWAFGTKNRQYFLVEHANRVKSNFQFGITLRKLSDRGFFNNLSNRTNNIELTSNHSDFGSYATFDSKNKKYKGIFTVVVNDYTYRHSGGVEEQYPGQLYDISQIWRREIVPVKLTEAVSRENNWTVALHNYYNIGRTITETEIEISKEENDTISKTDTTIIKRHIPALRLKHQISYTDDYITFDDVAGNDRSIYPEFIFDENYLFDFNRLKKWHNEFAIIQTGYGSTDDKIVSVPLKLYAGLHHELINIHQSFVSDTSFQNGYLSASIDDNSKKGLITFKGKLKFGFLGYQAGALKLSGKAAYQISKNLGSISGSYQLDRFENPFIFNRNRNNFFNWNNDLTKATVNTLGIAYNNDSIKLKVKYELQQYQNLAVWDADYSFSQIQGAVNRVSIEKNIAIGWWRMRNQLTFQSSNNTLIDIPTLAYYGSAYYSDNWFNKALIFQAGIDFYYTSNFKLPGYYPVIGHFTGPGENIYNQYPIIDVFFNFKIKQANFFFKTEYVNQGLFHAGYYGAVNYPQPDIALRGGISWAFYD